MDTPQQTPRKNPQQQPPASPLPGQSGAKYSEMRARLKQQQEVIKTKAKKGPKHTSNNPIEPEKSESWRVKLILAVFLLGLGFAVSYYLVEPENGFDLSDIDVSELTESFSQLTIGDSSIELSDKSAVKTEPLQAPVTTLGLNISRQEFIDTMTTLDYIDLTFEPSTIEGEVAYVTVDTPVIIELIGPADNLTAADIAFAATTEEDGNITNLRTVVEFLNIIDPALNEDDWFLDQIIATLDAGGVDYNSKIVRDHRIFEYTYFQELGMYIVHVTGQVN